MNGLSTVVENPHSAIDRVKTRKLRLRTGSVKSRHENGRRGRTVRRAPRRPRRPWRRRGSGMSTARAMSATPATAATRKIQKYARKRLRPSNWSIRTVTAVIATTLTVFSTAERRPKNVARVSSGT